MSEELTGRTRYRVHTPLFGCSLVVLQVEVRHGEGPLDFNMLPAYHAGTAWRDARVSDITTKEKAPTGESRG